METMITRRDEKMESVIVKMGSEVVKREQAFKSEVQQQLQTQQAEITSLRAIVQNLQKDHEDTTETLMDCLQQNRSEANANRPTTPLSANPGGDASSSSKAPPKTARRDTPEANDPHDEMMCACCDETVIKPLAVNCEVCIISSTSTTLPCTTKSGLVQTPQLNIVHGALKPLKRNNTKRLVPSATKSCMRPVSRNTNHARIVGSEQRQATLNPPRPEAQAHARWSTHLLRAGPVLHLTLLLRYQMSVR